MKLKNLIIKISKAYGLKKYRKQCQASCEKHKEAVSKKYDEFMKSTNSNIIFINK